MSEDDGETLPGSELEAPSRHARFVSVAYTAAFDRLPVPEEVAEQAAHLEAGLSPEDFLASLMASDERRLVVAARASLQARVLADSDPLTHFVTQAYRTVLGREPDDDGLALHAASLSEGLPPADLLAVLYASDEATNQREAASRPRLDLNSFVRTAFEAILHRPLEESAVAFFVDNLESTTDLVGFVRGLANSPEGQIVRGQQGAAPLNAACMSLTLFLERLLRERGMVLDLGPPPAANMPTATAERLLKRLVRTIETMTTATSSPACDPSRVKGAGAGRASISATGAPNTER